MTRRFGAVPTVFWLGIAIGLFGDALRFLASVVYLEGDYGSDKFETGLHLYGVARGCGVVESLFVLLGLFELADRLPGLGRKLMRGAGALFALSLAWHVLGLVLGASMASETVRDVFHYGGYVSAIVWYAAILLVIVAGRAWQTAPIAMIATIVIALVRGYTPYLAAAITEWVHDNKLETYWYFGGALSWALAFSWLLVGVSRDAYDAHQDLPRAEGGFSLAAKSLWWRIAAAGGIALLTLAASSGRTAPGKGMVVMVFVVGPGVVIASTLAFAIGLVRVAAARVEGLPQWLLLLGLAPVVWGLVPQLALAGGILAELLDVGRSFDATNAQPFPIASAVAISAGLCAICIAIARMRADSDPTLAEGATSALVGIILLSAISLAIQKWAAPKSQGEALFMLLIVAVTAISTIVLLARLLGRASHALSSDAVGLPSARVL